MLLFQEFCRMWLVNELLSLHKTNTFSYDENVKIIDDFEILEQSAESQKNFFF